MSPSEGVSYLTCSCVRGLEKEDNGELPDPYVKVYLLPDRSKDSKRKTDVIKDSCSPVFDERIEYALSPNELTQRTLEVSVINKKGFFHMQKSNVMGQVRNLFFSYLVVNFASIANFVAYRYSIFVTRNYVLFETFSFIVKEDSTKFRTL